MQLAPTPDAAEFTAAQAQARCDELLRQIPHVDLDLVDVFLELAVEWRLLACGISERAQPEPTDRGQARPR